MYIEKLMKCLLAVVCVAVLMTGCESGDDNDSVSDTGSGNTTVWGVLDSVSSDYVPGAVQGITVDLQQNGKTILQTVTQFDGRFVFHKVPAGEFTLVFHVNGGELTRDLTVAEQGEGSGGDVIVIGKVKVTAAGEVEDAQEVAVSIKVETEQQEGDPAPAFTVAGQWTLYWTWDESHEERKGQLQLAQSGGTLTGVLDGDEGVYNVKGSISGASVSLSFVYVGPSSLNGGLPAKLDNGGAIQIDQDNAAKGLYRKRATISYASGTAQSHSDSPKKDLKTGLPRADYIGSLRRKGSTSVIRATDGTTGTWYANPGGIQ